MSIIWLSVMSALASLDMSLALLKSSQETPATRDDAFLDEQL
jgi:hypothetical protein